MWWSLFLFQEVSSIEDTAESFGALNTLTEENAQNMEFVQSWLCVRLIPILPFITTQFISNMSKINFSCVSYQAMYESKYWIHSIHCRATHWNCGLFFNIYLFTESKHSMKKWIWWMEIWSSWSTDNSFSHSSLENVQVQNSLICFSFSNAKPIQN